MTIVSRHEEPKASKVTLIEFDSTIHSISITCYIQGLLVPLEESSQRETADSIYWRARQKKVEIDRIPNTNSIKVRHRRRSSSSTRSEAVIVS